MRHIHCVCGLEARTNMQSRLLYQSKRRRTCLRGPRLHDGLLPVVSMSVVWRQSLCVCGQLLSYSLQRRRFCLRGLRIQRGLLNVEVVVMWQWVR